MASESLEGGRGTGRGSGEGGQKQEVSRGDFHVQVEGSDG